LAKPNVFKRTIDRFAWWFADAFGSEASFGLWTVALVAWLAVIPFMGLSHWNSTIGLGGNTVESTLELFLEIAILIRANQIESRQRQQIDHIEQMVASLAHIKQAVQREEKDLAEVAKKRGSKPASQRTTPRTSHPKGVSV